MKKQLAFELIVGLQKHGWFSIGWGKCSLQYIQCCNNPFGVGNLLIDCLSLAILGTECDSSCNLLLTRETIFWMISQVLKGFFHNLILMNAFDQWFENDASQLLYVLVLNSRHCCGEHHVWNTADTPNGDFPVPQKLRMAIKYISNKAKWFAKQLASKSLQSKHPWKRTTLTKHSRHYFAQKRLSLYINVGPSEIFLSLRKCFQKTYK